MESLDLQIKIALARVVVRRFDYFMAGTPMVDNAAIRYGRNITFNRLQKLVRVGILISAHNLPYEEGINLEDEPYVGLLDVWFYYTHNIQDLDVLAETKVESVGLTQLQLASLQFISPSFSTARGIWIEKTAGTILDQIYPGLVAPNNLIADISYDDKPWMKEVSSNEQ